jgi:hypothetical protein
LDQKGKSDQQVDGGTVQVTGKQFSYEAFTRENDGSDPETLLPKNLDIFWIDAILGAQLCDDALAKDVAKAIITFACAVLVRGFGGEPGELHSDLYLQELLLEKLDRINTKAGVTNSGFAYLPAEVDDIFTGPHYSAQHMANLLKLVSGALDWEKRWADEARI